MEAIESMALVTAAGGSVAAVCHNGKTLWTVEGVFKIGKCVALLSRSPILGGIKAVYAAAHGLLLAISAVDGTQIWTRALN